MTQDLVKLHQQIIVDFDKIQSSVRDERLQCLQDRRFYSIAGAQWEGDLASQFENKPKFEVNKIHLSIIRIINEYRNNKIDVSFVSKDGKKNDDLAEVCNDLYRSDEQNSTAEEAYDNAFEEAIGGGIGGWRLRNCYEDEEDEEDEKQRIIIEPIYDADSCIFFDLNAKRQDKKDANYCYVLSQISKEAFFEKYGEDEEPSSVNKEIQQTYFDWSTEDGIYIAEYYKVEFKEDVIYTYSNKFDEIKKVKKSEIKEDAEIEKDLKLNDFKLIKQRNTKTKKIRKYIISGIKILEDCGYIAGKNIPIVMVFGKRWVVDSVERSMGHVRLAKDSQRLKNMQISKLAEITALSSIEKPIFTPEQIAGFQEIWREDNVKNYPYLPINALKDNMGNPTIIGAASFTKSPEIPPAMGALLSLTEQDIQDILGNQQAGEEIQPNISGKAVELIQNKLDMQSFIYISNFSKAIKRSGEIWLSMAKDIFVEESRELKGIGKNGEVDQIKINMPFINKETGAFQIKNDLSKADFDLSVDIGPTSASKRQATVRNLTGMMSITQDPETLQVLGAMAMMNMEGDGIDDVRKYFRKKLLRMGVVEPTDDEAKELQQELQNQQPDAQTQFLQASAQQAQAQAQKAQADIGLTLAKAEETKVKTAETISNMDLAHKTHVLDTIKAINDIKNNEINTNTQNMGV